MSGTTTNEGKIIIGPQVQCAEEKRNIVLLPLPVSGHSLIGASTELSQVKRQ